MTPHTCSPGIAGRPAPRTGPWRGRSPTRPPAPSACCGVRGAIPPACCASTSPLPCRRPRPLAKEADGDAPGDAGRWEVEVVHRVRPGEEALYRVVLAGAKTAPTFLSCADDLPKAETHYEAVAFTRLT